MRAILLLLVGACLGAAGFHLYYRGLDASARCGWDHPVDAQAKAACRATDARRGYAAEARHALDDLVGNVAN